MLSLREKETNRGMAWPIGSVVYSLDAVPSEGLLPLDNSYYDPNDPRYKKLFRQIGYRFGKNAENHFRVPLLAEYLSIHNPTSAGVDANATPFVKKGPYIRQHRHTSVRTSNDGSHGHTRTVVVVQPTPNAGTNGLGALATGSPDTQVSLLGSGDHSHTATMSGAEGSANWRPSSIITNAFVVCGVVL